jgi:ketosteroid isomerase-like protein
VAVIAEVTLRGITKEQYDAVRAQVRTIEEPPDGVLAHLAWWEGGDCHNCDAWESEEAFQVFGQQRLGPTLAALGIDVPMEVSFHPAHEVATTRRGIIAATPAPQPADNVARCRLAYERFAAGDIPGVLELLDDDVEWSTVPSLPFGGIYRGPSGAGEHLARLPQLYSELTITPEAWIDAGDAVVVQGTYRGRSVAGTPYETRYLHLWRFRNGKATAFTEAMDSAPVARALGEAIPVPRTAQGTAGAASLTPAQAEAVLRRMFDEIINQGRLDVADELFAEDYVDHGPMGDLRGREAFKGLVRQWRDAVPDVHCEVDTVVVAGDLCGWLVRTTGTHTGGGLGFPATGRRFETVSANIGRFRDGRAAEHWAEEGMFPMLVQLGIIPVPSPAGA